MPYVRVRVGQFKIVYNVQPASPAYDIKYGHYSYSYTERLSRLTPAASSPLRSVLTSNPYTERRLDSLDISASREGRLISLLSSSFSLIDYRFTHSL